MCNIFYKKFGNIKQKLYLCTRKPVMSNQITKWQNIKPFTIQGVVTEIKRT